MWVYKHRKGLLSSNNFIVHHVERCPLPEYHTRYWLHHFPCSGRYQNCDRLHFPCNHANIRGFSLSLYWRSLPWLCSEYLQRLSEESERVWREIKLLPPVELVAVWDHIICYREYVHDSIRIAFTGDQYMNQQQTIPFYWACRQQGNDDKRRSWGILQMSESAREYLCSMIIINHHIQPVVLIQVTN